MFESNQCKDPLSKKKNHNSLNYCVCMLSRCHCSPCCLLSSPTWPFFAPFPPFASFLHHPVLLLQLCSSTAPACNPHCIPSSSLLSPSLPIFSMSLYQEKKRGSPEGLWFVPAAAYTGLMRSLREGVSVSV